MLAHSLRDSVSRGSEGMAPSLGQLIPLCLQPGSRQVDADAQLASSFCFGSGTPAMNWCHPYSVWVFPPQSSCSENSLKDDSKSNQIDNER